MEENREVEKVLGQDAAGETTVTEEQPEMMTGNEKGREGGHKKTRAGANKAWKITGIILAGILLAVGGIATGMLIRGDEKKDEEVAQGDGGEKGEECASTDAKTEELAEWARTHQLVRDAIDGLFEEMDAGEWAPLTNGESTPVKLYNVTGSLSAMYKLGDSGGRTDLDDAYELSIPLTTDQFKEYEQLSSGSEEASSYVRGANSENVAKVIQMLKNRGFLDYDKSELSWNHGSYINNDGVICSVYMFFTGVSLVCGHETWISEQRKNDREGLAKVYREALGKDIEYVPPLKPYDGKDSHQYVEVDSSWFYRVSPESEWQYLATQTGNAHVIPKCAWFDDEDKKKAFAGATCYNAEGDLEEFKY